MTEKTAVGAVRGRGNRGCPFLLVTIEAQFFRLLFLDFIQLVMISAMEKLRRGLGRGVPEKQENPPADNYKKYV